MIHKARRHERIVADVGVMTGKPTIKGTRITVELILRKLGAGMTCAEIIADHPHLTADDNPRSPGLRRRLSRGRGGDPGRAVRLLVDECCDPRLVAALRQAGHDVRYVLEVNSGASDQDLVALSIEQDRILITEDKDFGELVIRHGKLCRG